MSSTVKSRPSHYEILGLPPGASSDEISQAFAKEVLRPRAFGSLAEVTVAYETLRDRRKREAYDLSLGLQAEQPAPPPPSQREWAPFAMRASARPAPRPAPKADAIPRSEARPELKVSPFVTAASPSEPSNADFRELRRKPKVPAEQPHKPETMAKANLEPRSGGGLLQFDEARPFQFDSANLSQWKLPALAVGVLVLAVGLGAWTGLEAGNDNTQANAVTLKVPAAKPIPEIAGSPLALAPSEAEDPPQQPTRPAAARVERPRPPLQIDLPESGEAAQLESPADELVTAQRVVESPSVEATAAKMPLPNAVIARTISRIGYPCDQVATTTAMGGVAAGVFKVTCTSGHSYRAAPVRGRYRFRQLASR